MIFKVSSDDVFGKTAIIVEVVEKVLRKSPNKSSGENLAADYWDIIPRDVQLDESSMKPTKRVLSHAQVASLQKNVSLKPFLSFLFLFYILECSFLWYLIYRVILEIGSQDDYVKLNSQ